MTHLRKMMLEELERRNYAQTTTRIDWLLDHKGEFELLVTKQIGQEVAATIDWTSPRLCCIAGDFTRYDEHAVQQINRNIELIRYRPYGDTLLLLELVNATSREPIVEEIDGESRSQNSKTFVEYLAQSSAPLKDLRSLARTSSNVRCTRY